MDKTLIIGDKTLHVVIRTLILGLAKFNDRIPTITEEHVTESVVIVSNHIILFKILVLFISSRS